MMAEYLVVLDPGHGGHQPGAVAQGLEEKTLNLELARRVRALLSGYRVALTREEDRYVSLEARVARAQGADLFVSLHANAGGGRGFESFVAPGCAASAGMQGPLHGAVMEALKPWEIRDRGMKEANFFVLRNNEAPAVLLESLFIDNAREAALWRKEAFKADLARGVAKGIRAALGEEQGSNLLFTVQAGAFALEENARRRLAQVQAAGFSDAFLFMKEV